MFKLLAYILILIYSTVIINAEAVNSIAADELTKMTFELHEEADETIKCNIASIYPGKVKVSNIETTSTGGTYQLSGNIGGGFSTLNFSLSCLSKNSFYSNPQNLPPVAFSSKYKKWVSNIDQDNEYHQSIKASLKVESIKGRDFDGYIYTTVERNSSSAVENFDFCLFKESSVLCGGGSFDRHPKNKFDLPSISAVISRNITFIN